MHINYDKPIYSDSSENYQKHCLLSCFFLCTSIFNLRHFYLAKSFSGKNTQRVSGDIFWRNIHLLKISNLTLKLNFY